MCVLACATSPRAAGAIVVTDDVGNTVRLPHTARRIISLAPHATENLFSAGAGEFVVGVSAFSDFPPQAKSLPVVADYSALDLERIIALQPDLVVAWYSGNPRQQIDKLRQLGMQVFYSEPRSFEAIASNVEALGRLVGREAAAEAATGAFRAAVDRLRHEYSVRPTLRVFYQIWDRPLTTVGGSHIIDSAIRLCGAQNIFADIESPAATVDLEAAVIRGPQVIVASSEKSGDEWRRLWEQFPQTPAVRDKAMFTLPPDLINRHSLRIVEAASQLCELLERARVGMLRPIP